MDLLAVSSCIARPVRARPGRSARTAVRTGRRVRTRRGLSACERSTSSGLRRRCRAEAEPGADTSGDRRLEPGRRRAAPRGPGRRPSSGAPSATTVALAHDDDPAEVARGELHVVGDGDDRPAARAGGIDDRADARDARAVLAGRRLVEHEDRRLHREHAGQRDELASRQAEVVGVGRPDVGEARRMRGRARRAPRRRRRPEPEVARAEARPRARPSG